MIDDTQQDDNDEDTHQTLNHIPFCLCPMLQQVPIANGTTNPCSSAKCEVKLELAFEYLMSKDRLQWVTITSQQVSARPAGISVTENHLHSNAVTFFSLLTIYFKVHNQIWRCDVKCVKFAGETK